MEESKEYFFVRRPTVAIVLSIILVILGLVSLRGMPIAQYPDVIPPEVQVSSTYLGAHSVAVEQSVTTPLEQKINGVENMIYIRSINANDGTSSVRISFKVGANLDMSNVLVQNRVSEAEPSLPEEVKQMGVAVKKSLSFPLLLVTVQSPDGTYDSSFLSNYAAININDAIARIPGVGQVMLFGGSEYGMRIWIKPDQLASRGITVNDLYQAIRGQNVITAGGQIGAPPSPPGTDETITVQLRGRLQTPEEFGEIIVKADPDGSLIRIQDIARVELGSQLYNAMSRLNEKPAATLAIYQIPGSNALEVATQVRSTMNEIAKRFPEDLQFSISLDTTKSVTEGIKEIIHTLIEAIFLVVIVVMVFLQNWRATLIPLLTVPVSLIATFAVFPFIGFGINTLSLLGLVLAIGIVVDDAIVVVEAVMHHIEHGKSPREATVAAMREVAGPVIAIALILASVFLPVLFMGGVSGRFYQQFAVTIGVSVLLSALSALTLTPALCSMLLKAPSEHQSDHPFFRPVRAFYDFFNKEFLRFTNGYLHVAGFFARKLFRTAIVFAVIIGGILFFGKLLPVGFIPEEDQGYILANLQLPDARSLQRTDNTAKIMEGIMLDTPGIESVTSVSGFSLITQSYASNTAFFFIWLKPWEDRSAAEESSKGIVQALNKRFLKEITGAQAFAFGPPAIPGLGTGSGFSMFLQDRGGNSPEYLAEHVGSFMAKAKERKEIANIATPFRASVPQFLAELNREKLFKQGISIDDATQTLGTFLGGAYVNDFNRFGRLYKVYIQAEPDYRDEEDDLRLFHVRNNENDMAPLSSFLNVKKISGPEYTNRFNLYRAAELIGQPAPGFTSLQALAALEEVAAETLPADMSYDWNAMSYQEKHSEGGAIVFLLGTLFVFLLLAAQYESWSLPFSVLLGTPIVVLGALGGLWICRIFFGPVYENNIFAQIGMLTLVGLAAKNAILIVEFARVQKEAGMSALDAAMYSAKLRLRPILMTAFAFILGVVPLVTATGAGAAGRQILGLGVLSGMLVATLVGVTLVPAFFVFIENFFAGKTKT